LGLIGDGESLAITLNVPIKTWNNKKPSRVISRSVGAAGTVNPAGCCIRQMQMRIGGALEKPLQLIRSLL
tara:strand:- start:1755 stop:1964 length:210 start_codon:yes stop_codon:yes gene_type:complete